MAGGAERAAEAHFVRRHDMARNPMNRNPVVAALLTLPAPGLGHLYAGRTTAAAVAFLLPHWLLALIIAAALLHVSAATFLVIVLLTLATIVAMVLHAGLVAARAPRPYQLQPYNRWWLYLLLATCFLFVWRPGLRWVMRRVVQAYRIPSSAMEPNILVGDFLYADQRPSARTPRLNDVVVFRSVMESGVSVIKRVVGLPGDTLETRAGQLRRNGKTLVEPWVRALSRADTMLLGDTAGSPIAQLIAREGWTMFNWGPVVVPPYSYFVMGDNRPNSYDSRFYGPIPADHIVGQPTYLYMSLDHESRYAVRWDRIGTTPWVVPAR